MAIDFYFSRSGNSMRAAIALELSDQAFDKHFIDLAKKEHKSDSILALNPAGHVPLIVLTEGENRKILTQSGAIMEYFLRKYRQDLYPKDEVENALCNASFLASLSDIAIQHGLARYLGEEHPKASQFVFDRMISDLQALFLPVQDTPYLCGNDKTIADYAHFPTIYMRESQIQKTNAPHIIEWLKRMQKDTAISKAIEYSGVQI